MEEIQAEEALERGQRVTDGDDTRSLPVAQQEKLVTVDFAKKYIHYAKNRMKPKLTDEANDRISSAYAEMRSGLQKHTSDPVSPLATIFDYRQALFSAMHAGLGWSRRAGLSN